MAFVTAAAFAPAAPTGPGGPADHLANTTNVICNDRWEAVRMYGHRAYLLWNIEESFRELSENYTNIKHLIDTIYMSFGNDVAKKPDPHFESGIKYLFIGAYSCFEGYLSDVVKEILLSFPGKLSKKSIHAEKVIQSGTKQEYLELLVEEEIRNVSASNPPEILKYLQNTISNKIKWTQDMTNNLWDMRSKRNLVVHSGSKINHTFVGHAKNEEHAKNIGKKITISEKENREYMDLLLRMANEVRVAAKEKYADWTKAKVFREMWIEAGLTSVLEYSEFWDESDDGSMVYPKERPWGWGTSQGLLVEFFKFIHNGRDFPGAVLSRFPNGSKERKIVLDWLQDQFYL